MSYALTAAISLPGGPMLLVVPAGAIAIVILALALVVGRKRKAKKAARSAWALASEELGIEMVRDGSELGAVATGRVNNHVVSIAPMSRKGRKNKVATQFSVKFEAPEAPQFRLVKRTGTDAAIIDTGNPKFDAVVAIETEQPVLLSRFLTGPRRAAILRVLTYWPEAQLTNRTAHLTTPGIEIDHDKLVDSICHLVATAETFDRPTVTVQAEPTSEPATVVDAGANHAPQPLATEPVAPPPPAPDADAVAPMIDTTPAPEAEHVVHGDADVLTEVRLDELTVLGDLFATGLGDADIAARFQQVYQGRDVAWTGEVLRVGSFDDTGRQRIAALIGSADGQDPNSGRVVALTAVGPEPVLSEGDVVNFSGSLVNLDVTQRLFHVA